MKNLHIVDGTHFMHRAFHAVGPLSTSSGIPTGAIKGFVNILHRMITEFNIEYLVIVFDPKKVNTFRTKLYPEYKAGRSKDGKEDLYPQIKIIRKILPKAGFCTIRCKNFEADDVIGTIAKRFIGKFDTVYIHSNDKDFAQLLEPNIVLVKPDGTLIGHKNCEDHFHVKANKIVSWLMLQGDGVDNIPGIPGVGPKIAAQWINDYGTVKKILKAATKGNLKGRGVKAVKDALEKGTLPNFKLTKKLLTIKTDCDDVLIPTKVKQFAIAPLDRHWLTKAKRKLEFGSLFGI